MRDRSKQLLVINTGKKQSEQTGLPSQAGTTHIIGGGGLSVNMSDYLLKSIWDKVFEIRTDSQGTEYIFGKLPVVTQYGITMYSGDSVDVPSLASGLPFDGRTIWYNPDTQQIEVIGGTGGGSGEGVSNFWDLSGIPSWITNSKPKYTYSEIEGTPDLSGFATQNWITSQGYASAKELKKYIPISGYTEVSGEKNFTGGLKVNGSPIYYDSTKKYWKLEGDLLVTGGVTMYGNEGTYTPSTIMDAIAVDGTTISKSGGVLKVIGGTGGGSGEGVSNFWDLSGIPSWITNSKPKYTYSEIEGTPDLTKYALVSQIPSLSGYATESWVTQQNYATKATTLSGYGITDAYTKTNVDDLLKAYVTLGGRQTITGEKNFTGGLKVNGSPIYYDTEKKYWKLEGDLLVTGGVTMYGSDSSFTPSTIMDAIAVDGVTISKSGGVLKVIGGTGGGVADSVAWANITGKPTWIGSSKPSYSYSEITGAISTTELQNYLTQNSYLNVTGGDNRYLKLSGGTMGGDIVFQGGYLRFTNTSGSFLGAYNVNGSGEALYLKGSTWNRILHSGNYSNYALPLSGGTLDGVLTLRASNSSSDSWIEFSNKSNSVVHKLGVRRPESSYGLQYYNGSEYYKIWHEGNDGSGSTLDADLLDGLHNGELTALVLSKYSDTWNYSLGNPGLSVFSDWNNTQSLSGYFYGISIESVDNRFRTVLATPLWSDGLHWRQYSDGAWQEDWRCLIDSYNIGYYNAGSATKLQTARTIWGQSFDGTGNVSGNLTLENNYEIVTKNTSGSISSTLYRTKSNNLSIGEGIAKESNDTYISGNNLFLRYGTGLTNGISLISSGNVGVGTTSPTKKLHIYDSNVSNDSILLLEKGNAYDSRLELTNSVDSFSITQQSTGNAYISLRGNHSLIFETSNSSRLTIDSSGNVGVGTITPSYKLDVNGDIATSQYLRVKAWSGYGSGICSMWYNGNTTQLVLDSGASLGYNLDVNGIISANSSNAMSLKLNSSKIDWGFAYNSIGIYHSDSQKGGFGWNSEPAGLSNVGLYFKNYVSGDCISLFNEGGICFIGGNIGIGTASPTYKLDVSGEIRMSGAGIIGGGLYFTGIGSGTYNKGTIMSTPTYGYEIEAPRATDSATGTALPIFIGWRGGALGIKITSGGNLLANGGITMYSDQRKKTILNHVELSLKQIAEAPLIEHYYNGDEKKTTHVGSIAQYWASMNDWFCKFDSEGYYTMEIQNAALASAISIARELDRYETKTDKAIKKLKKRISELEDEVERLKSA